MPDFIAPEDPEPKICDTCKRPMDYTPRLHFTGKRWIVLAHIWRCVDHGHVNYQERIVEG